MDFGTNPIKLNCFIRYNNFNWVPAEYRVVSINPDGTRVLEFFEPGGKKLKKPDDVKMARPEEIAKYMAGNSDKVIIMKGKK